MSTTPEALADVSPIRASSGASSDLNGISLLLLRFSDAVDGRRPADVAAQFAEDGLFKPGSDAILGRAQIEAFYWRRLSDERRRTRHVWSNLCAHPMNESAVRISVTLVNYAFEPAVSQENLQFRIGNVSGLCVKDREGLWRFAEQLYERTFTACLPLQADPGSPAGR